MVVEKPMTPWSQCTAKDRSKRKRQVGAPVLARRTLHLAAASRWSWTAPSDKRRRLSTSRVPPSLPTLEAQVSTTRSASAETKRRSWLLREGFAQESDSDLESAVEAMLQSARRSELYIIFVAYWGPVDLEVLWARSTEQLWTPRGHDRALEEGTLQGSIRRPLCDWTIEYLQQLCTAIEQHHGFAPARQPPPVGSRRAWLLAAVLTLKASDLGSAMAWLQLCSICDSCDDIAALDDERLMAALDTGIMCGRVTNPSSKNFGQKTNKLQWFETLLASGSDEEIEAMSMATLYQHKGNGVGVKVHTVVRAYYERDPFAVVVDSNVLTVLADLEAVEALGQPKGEDVVQFPAKGWDKNGSASANVATSRIRERLQEIAAPPGLAFRLTVALNVFGKHNYKETQSDGSTQRCIGQVLIKAEEFTVTV